MSDEPYELSCDHEAARLLPWFVAGALPAPDSTRVQTHLQECRLCAADEQRERRIRELVCSEPALEHVPQPGLHKLMSRIDELERELPSQPDDVRGQPSGRSSPRPRLVRWLTAAVLLQAVGLGLLGSLLWQTSRLQQPRFSTLSAPALAADSGGSVRVVFAPAMTAGEIQSLLSAVSATVVAGPSEAGVYTLTLEDKQERIGVVLARLRATPGVLFAEPQLPPEQRP